MSSCERRVSTLVTVITTVLCAVALSPAHAQTFNEPIIMGARNPSPGWNDLRTASRAFFGLAYPNDPGTYPVCPSQQEIRETNLPKSCKLQVGGRVVQIIGHGEPWDAGTFMDMPILVKSIDGNVHGWVDGAMLTPIYPKGVTLRLSLAHNVTPGFPTCFKSAGGSDPGIKIENNVRVETLGPQTSNVLKTLVLTGPYTGRVCWVIPQEVERTDGRSDPGWVNLTRTR